MKGENRGGAMGATASCFQGRWRGGGSAPGDVGTLGSEPTGLCIYEGVRKWLRQKRYFSSTHGKKQNAFHAGWHSCSVARTVISAGRLRGRDKPIVHVWTVEHEDGLT